MNENKNFLYSVNTQVFDFIDFRDYLEKVISELRQRDPKLTFRKLSALFGFKSPNFLLLLAQKKRKMSATAARQMAITLHLPKKEREYFLLMVESINAKNGAERELITKRMLQIQRGLKNKNLEPAQYELYEKWYQVILREILILPGIPQNYSFLSAFFEEKITESEIEKALEKLANLKLIERRNKRWQNKKENLKTGDFFSNTFIVLFHKKMLELATKSLDRYTGKQRYLSTLSLPISDETNRKIRELIEEFKTKAVELCEETKGANRIMQLNLQFFPMTKVHDENS